MALLSDSSTASEMDEPTVLPDPGRTVGPSYS